MARYLTHGYDGASRLASTSFSNGEPTITRDYDGQGRRRFNALAPVDSRLTYAWGDAVGTDFPVRRSRPLAAVSYAYDLAGRQSRITWPGSYWVDYDFNSAGVFVACSRAWAAASGLGASCELDVRWAWAGARRFRRGNGAVTSAWPRCGVIGS